MLYSRAACANIINTPEDWKILEGDEETKGQCEKGGGTVFLTHYGLFLSSGVLPPIANNGDCPCLLGE